MPVGHAQMTAALCFPCFANYTLHALLLYFVEVIASKFRPNSVFTDVSSMFHRRRGSFRITEISFSTFSKVSFKV